MELLFLKIINFRNIPDLEIEPAGGVNLLWGENGQGKTNILEAIYYLVTGRSFRARQDREVLPWDLPSDGVTILEGRVQTEETRHQITVGISRNQKRVSCNGKTLASLGLLWGKMNAVLFTPNDLDIIQGPPGERRRFLDMEGSQISPGYLYHLQRYAQILRQRNALLKSAATERELLESLAAWDEAMILSAAEIFCFRRGFLTHLAREASRVYHGLTDDGETLELTYDNFLSSDDAQQTQPVIEELYRRALAQSRAEDLYRGMTGCGPHRDDFSVLIQGKDSRSYASQGQQRSAVIALRLGEIALMRELTGRAPLLLLDDIVSELDEGRRRRLLGLLDPARQTFITGTDADLLAGALPVEKSLRIHQGGVME